MDEQIDVRGDGRIVLYRRSNAANGIYHVRLRIPGSNGYKRLSTKHSNRRDAEHFALNLYDPAEAAEGTLRKLYATSMGENAVHGSDSDENASIEAAFHFSQRECF